MNFPRLLLTVAAFCCVVLSASAQTINPADYGNLTLHLKADALSQSNNTAVTAWGPLTASGSNTPTYLASDSRFNNKPVVRFDGVDDVMKWASASLNARTIFAVVTMESAAGTLAGLISNGSDGLNVRRNNTASFYRSVGQGMDANDFVGNGTPTGNLYVNNVVSGSFTPSTPHLVMAVAGGQKSYGSFWIGSASSTLGRYWNGSVAEVIVYDGVLTSEGIDRVGWYLQNKYNLPTKFPGPTPNIQSFTAAVPGPISSGIGVLSTAGAPVTLSWNVGGTATMTIDNGALASSSSATGSVTVAPTVSTTYTLTASNSFGSVTKSLTVYVGVTPQAATVSEFVADANGGFPDEDGDNSDWIEIYNPNPFALDLQNYVLKDSGAQWAFPAGSVVDANGYRVVFASGKNRRNPTSNLHTSFSLSAGGEYLALLKPDGSTVTEFAPAYPAQRKGASGGLGTGGAPVYFLPPTPGAPNGSSVIGFVEDTAFSVKRGFFSAPFQLSITTATSGATIRYTLDASTPTETNGTTYTGPITISRTTTLRVRAFLNGYAPTNTDTQTYLFLNDVLNQVYPSTPPTGWPLTGVNGQALRYGWNSTLKAQYTPQQLLDALRQIPTLSIVTDQANLTNATTGIYVNALEKGDLWERAASVEYLQPDNTPGFHVNAGLRIRGGNSRNDGFPKHSLRLFFRGVYGDAKLKFPLHGTSGTDEFETLDLRTEQNYSWVTDSGTQNTAVREVFCRDLMAALGEPTTRTRYVHLYLNGQYWGLYQTEERAQQDYGASYFGGNANDYDVVQTSNHPDFTYEVSAGTVDAWQTLWNMARAHAASPTAANYFKIFGRDPNGERNSSLPVYLDLDNLINYILLHYYTGDGDAPLSNFLGMNKANNWRGMRSRVADIGFRFFVHDSEHTLQASSWVDNRANTAAPNGSNRSNFTYSNPEWIHEDLSANPEYRIRFADLAHKALFNNGPMTPTAAQSLFDARAAQISQAIVADVSRWGTNSTNHTLAQWQNRLNTIRTGFFPTRHTALISHLRSRGFYPSVNAPTFSQRGGQVVSGYQLTLSAGSQTGTVYYTLDGSDPRAVGGGIAGTAYAEPGIVINTPTLVRMRFRSSTGVWSALDEAYFTTFVPATAGKLVITKLHYHPTNPTAEEIAAGYTSDSDFEYIELQNISNETLDLRGVQFTNGVTFSFSNSAVQTLAPGARVLVAGNAAALVARYGPGLPIAGTFAGDLSNSGEFIRVADGSDATIVQFTYSDTASWPARADGGGFALVLNSPNTNPDHNVATNWRASYAPGGKPGGVDQISVADWRTLYFSAADLADPAKEATFWGNAADADGDGVANLAEFALGTSPVDALSRPEFVVSTWTDSASSLQYLALTTTVLEGSTGITITPEASGDLTAWQSGLLQIGPAVSQGDGTALVTYRDTIPVSGLPDGRRFLRMRIQGN